jgi:hypothetical protein
MTFLLLVPAILSLLVFCAHLLRSGAGILIPLVLMSLALLLVKHGLVARFFQFMLTLVAAQWVLTAIFSAREHAASGQPWLRMAIILGSVALFTFVSALLFEAPPLARRYPRTLTF